MKIAGFHFRSAIMAALALATGPLCPNVNGQSLIDMPFETTSSSSFQNFGSTGGTATSVVSPYGIGPAPTLNNTRSYTGSWSLYCTPNSANAGYAGSLLLPTGTTKFQMDTAASRMTISTWICWNGIFGSNPKYGIAGTHNYSNNTGWVFYIQSSGKITYRFIVPTGAGQVAARERSTVNPVITPGQWTHVVATVDCSVAGNSAIKIYINGVEQATEGSGLSSIIHVPSVGLEVAVGSYTHGIGAGGHLSLNGYLDDFQMWDKIYSAAKIQAMVQAPDLLPNHTAGAMDSLFAAFDAQGSVVIDELTWNYASSGIDVTGRTLGDVWKGPGGKYYTWLGGTAQSPVGMIGSPKRTNFAHYMGCYVAGNSGFNGGITYTSNYMDPASTNLGYAMGAYGVTNFPLVPQGGALTPAQSAEMEIKRAIRAGFDGFAIDAWAGGDIAKNALNELIAAAERLGVDFKITICMDNSCHATPTDGVMVQPLADSINWLIDNHGDSPNLARRHGKVLIFTYQSFNILKDPAFKALPENLAKWTQISDAWDRVRSLVSEPLFLHGEIDTMVERAPTQYVAIAQWAGQHFDAVGGFLGSWTPEKNPEIAAAAMAAGAEWSQPIFPHYYSRGGGINIEPGTNKLRRGYDSARSTGATLLQVVTWNDYGEDTNIAPSYSSSYTLMKINKFQSDWWKTGSAPAVTQDQMHLIFRRVMDGTISWPFGSRRHYYNNVNFLEVTTMLTGSGTVTVPGYGTYEAPSGYYVQQFPLQPGAVSATLTRSGTTVASAESPERVSDKPFREDNDMVCFSSNYYDEWAQDFGTTPPLLYSEYGDIDSDGLPNWFEMYYFGDGIADKGEVGWRGDFPIMATASSPDPRGAPNADPDGDGFTNLQEYINQTDPKIADVPYPVGYIWDTSAIEARGLSFNGDQDSHRKSVWFYYWRHGVEHAIPQDGNYDYMTAYGLQQNGPSNDPDGLIYGGGNQFGALITRRQVAGVWQTQFKPRDNAAAILCWKSPVSGTVSLSFDVPVVESSAPVGYQMPFVIDIRRNKETTTLGSISVQPGQTGSLAPLSITVQKGDSVYLFSYSWGLYSGSLAYLTNIKVKLLQNTGL